MDSAMRLLKHTVAGALLALGLSSMPALSDVIVVVSSKNPVTTLSKNQVADIFLGKSARFPDGSSAVPIDQTEGTVAREEFYKEIDRSRDEEAHRWQFCGHRLY
jgi:hypothetical protein